MVIIPVEELSVWEVMDVSVSIDQFAEVHRDEQAAERFIGEVYERLRRLMYQINPPGRGPDPTSLLHRALLTFLEGDLMNEVRRGGFVSPTAFVSEVARKARYILLDLGRQKALEKKALDELGNQRLFDADGEEEQRSNTTELITKLEALDAALLKLKSQDQEAHEVAMMYYFTRLTQDEIASVLGLHRSEIYRRHKRMRDFLGQLVEEGPKIETA